MHKWIGSALVQIMACRLFGAKYIVSEMEAILSRGRCVSPFHYFPIFQNYWSIDCLLHITFIFDKCHHSEAAVTPVKYECHLSDPVDTFAKSEIYFMEKLISWAHENIAAGPHYRIIHFPKISKYCQTSNISYILASNNIVDHSYVVGASLVSAVPTTSSFLT